MSVLPRLAIAALMIAASPVALAESFEDDATGLAVDASDAWTGARAEDDGADAMFGFTARSGTPPIAGNSGYLCAVNFTAAPQNGDLSQAEINEMIISDNWQEMSRSILSQVMIIDTAEPFMRDGVRGFEFTATPRVGPDAQAVRLYLTMLETPKGRTAQSCATTRDAFETALPMFRELRDGTTPPK
ncbi:hypothetical protein [Devosia sp.]|uniref:hypothetical protein n=1 Tax=Devosia sp. TaxID=1871048 RepID=UPI003A93038A